MSETPLRLPADAALNRELIAIFGDDAEVRACTRRNFLREDIEGLLKEDGDLGERPVDIDELPEQGWAETRIDEGLASHTAAGGQG